MYDAKTLVAVPSRPRTRRPVNPDLDRPAHGRPSADRAGPSPVFPQPPLPGVCALVLAGGRGTRLDALTAHCAKPAVPFGGALRIIDFTLSNCLNSGITRIAVLTQYRGQTLIPHVLGNWARFAERHRRRIDVLEAPEDGIGYAGTADAVFRNRDWLCAQMPREVLILAGDHVYDMDYADMVLQHRRAGAKLTVGCVEVPLAEASSFGVMSVDRDARIVAFDEKPRCPQPIPGRSGIALASMGIYVFDTAYLLDQLDADRLDAASSHDFGQNLVPAAVREGEARAHALRDPRDPARLGYWRDVGTVEAYWRCNLDLLESAAATPPRTDARPWPLWNGGDAPVNLAAAAAGRLGSACQRTVAASDAQLDAGSEIWESVLLPGVVIEAGCTVRRAVVEPGCRIPAGTRIGIDPAEDRSRFHVTPGGVVLVTAAGLRTASPAAVAA